MVRAVCALLIAVFLAAPVSADVGAAKSAGQVCEQTNGYLRANAGAPSDVQALVKNVNAQRKKHYASIATKNSIEVDQVARLTAEKVINKAPQFACK